MKFAVDGKDYEFDDASMTFAEGRAIEKVTGVPFGEVGTLAKKGSMTAIQAMVWVAMKRAEPTLKFSDLDDRPISSVEFAVADESDDEGDEAGPTDGEG